MLETTTAPVRFRAELERTGRTTTAVEVPEALVTLLRGGPRAKVTATIDGRTFRASITRSGDRYLLRVRAESRRAAGLVPGDVVDVALALDAFARMVAPLPGPGRGDQARGRPSAPQTDRWISPAARWPDAIAPSIHPG